MNVKIYCGDNLEVLRSLESDSIDSVVTDPPYGVSKFGGNNFSEENLTRNDNNYQVGADHKSQNGRAHCMVAGDYDTSNEGALRFQYSCHEWATELFRVMKPGAYILASCSTKMYHRMACGVEDAGFEVKDQAVWMFGKSFPKTVDISKAIDKKLKKERKVTGLKYKRKGFFQGEDITETEPASAEAKQWDGWGTGLKPTHEPILLARKPISQKTLIDNVLKFGTGGININAVKITDGRYPSNTLISNEVAEELGDKAKFFFTAKVSAKEREQGCKNTHPTVKPIELMEYLVKMITPPNGTVLDLFMGSATTGVAAVNCGFSFVGIELEKQYYDIARKRINHAIGNYKKQQNVKGAA